MKIRKIIFFTIILTIFLMTPSVYALNLIQESSEEKITIDKIKKSFKIARGSQFNKADMGATAMSFFYGSF